MRRQESSRFVQMLIREEPHPSAVANSEPAASGAPALAPRAVSRLAGALSGGLVTANSSPAVFPQGQTLASQEAARSGLSSVARPVQADAATGSFEVGGEDPAPLSTRAIESNLPQVEPRDRPSLSSIASAQRAERRREESPPTSDSLDGIRSAQKLSVTLPPAVGMASIPVAAPPARSEARPGDSGPVRYSQGIDEIFDQVWVKVQRRIGRPTSATEDDLEGMGIEHRNIQSIIVTSWGDDEGTSTVSLGLAGRAGASLPGKICLVDADFLGRGLTRASSLTGHKGLADLLTNQASLEEVLVEGEGVPFVFLPAGLHVDPASLATDARLQEVIRSLEDRFRYVFYDVSSLKHGVEAYRWGRFVVNTILVVRAGVTRRQTVRHAVDQLHLHGMDLLGTILNERVDVIPNWLYAMI